MDNLLQLLFLTTAAAGVFGGMCLAVWRLAPPFRDDHMGRLMTVASLIAFSGLCMLCAIVLGWRLVSLFLISGGE